MGSFLKYLSLGILTLQTTTLVLMLRYSRMASAKTGTQYLVSTAVVMVELMKLVTCCALVWCEKGFHCAECFHTLHLEVMLKPLETMKMSVPSFLYVVQNNLLYIALTNLDAATYQVTYQMKILTTAIFSVLLLNRKLELQQWISLVLLVIGVALVQVPSSKPDHLWSISVFSSTQLIGLTAVILACFSSGFAGVYFEKILKNTQQSLWIRNIQLGFFGLFFALFGALLNDCGQIKELGFFQGYNRLTWTVISLQAFGGILVAVVIKYADNILKSFAASVSIILSAIISYFILGDLNYSRYFLLGTSVVLAATFLYIYQPPTRVVINGVKIVNIV